MARQNSVSNGKNKRLLEKLSNKLDHSALKGIFNPLLEQYFGVRRKKDQEPTKEHINLATSVQSAFEESLQQILKPAIENYPEIKKLVITGGCALNVTANGNLLRSNQYLCQLNQKLFGDPSLILLKRD